MLIAWYHLYSRVAWDTILIFFFEYVKDLLEMSITKLMSKNFLTQPLTTAVIEKH